MVIMLGLLLIIIEGRSDGCLDQEKIALLRLQHFFNDILIFFKTGVIHWPQ